ncbi:hypothetical protein [Planobispora rosea]|uniref:hypothetical protein n=1 Tax=Planobispora rosea TaxID=35762 RepID=UPI00083B17F4|nr:hypothetical protein [Planobispora rosea]
MVNTDLSPTGRRVLIPAYTGHSYAVDDEQAGAVFDHALGYVADGWPFTPAALADVLDVTGQSRSWLLQQLAGKVRDELLERDPSQGTYTVIDPARVLADAHRAELELAGELDDPPATPSWRHSLRLLQTGPHTEAAAAMSELTTLAVALARTAEVPRITLSIGRQNEAVSGECDAATGTLVLGVDEMLLYGEATTADGQAAAGAMAYQITAATWRPPRILSLIGHVFGLAVLALMVAAITAAPAALMSALIGATLGVGLAHQHRAHHQIYALDAAAARALDEAGLDGRACLEAMFTDLERTEGRIYRWISWHLEGFPPARKRRQQLTRRYAAAA